ncbi:MAG: reverse transcriptase domain-containing protein [Sedimenticola sp.]
MANRPRADHLPRVAVGGVAPNSGLPLLTLPPPPAPLLPVGGRLAHFIDKWEEITDDAYALSIVRKGYTIPFHTPPILLNKPVYFPARDQSHTSLLLEVVNELLEKRAVEMVVDQGSPGFYSRLFLVKKKNGKLRPVIDLSPLNKCVQLERFKMETQKSVQIAIRKDFWTVSIDLQDAYLHVPIRPSYRKYLRFTICGRVFQFRVLPFGLSTAPMVFTRLMKCVAAFIRKQGPSLIQYLDDWLIYHISREVLERHLSKVWEIVTRLGLLPNMEKSDLVPSQSFEFIGMYFQTNLGTVRVPADRVDRIVQLLSDLTRKSCLTARKFLSLLGTLNAAADFVEMGRLHIRPLQLLLHSLWRPQSLPLDHIIWLDQTDFKHHIQWWLQPQRLSRGVPMHSPQPQLHLYTDSSRYGWGAHLEPQGTVCQGIWPPDHAQLHINLLELRAVSMAMHSLLHLTRGKCVMIATDNSTVVSYIRKQGGTHSLSLFQETWDLLQFCHQNSITTRVRHIPGRLNVIADSLSRGTPIPTEWSISPLVAQSLFNLWGTPTLDLFATRFNNKLPRFVSPVPDKGAQAVDALAISWENLFGYAFPPPKLIQQVLRQVRRSNARIILLAPNWPRMSWFNDLLDLLIDFPRSIPSIPRLLTQNNISHSNPGMFHLHGWMLSGILSEREDFLLKLPDTSHQRDALPPTRCTRQDGESSEIGVVQTKLIHSIPLFLE